MELSAKSKLTFHYSMSLGNVLFPLNYKQCKKKVLFSLMLTLKSIAMTESFLGTDSLLKS